MSRNACAPRVIVAVFAWVTALSASTGPSAAASPDPVVLEVDRRVEAAVRGLGDGVRFFTARARPLRRLSEIARPGVEVGSADLELARGVMALLRAGGVGFPGGAFDVMTLVSDNHLPSLFGRGSTLRLFVLRGRPDGTEATILGGGGVPLIFRGPGGGSPFPATTTASSAPAQAAAPPKAAEVRTSFGPLRRVQRSQTARHRTFLTSDQGGASDKVGARIEEKRARTGHTFMVLHIARDFAAGAGKVSFLFGSGIILEPDFGQVQLLDGTRRLRPTAVHADGPTLELAYEVPSRAKTLRLQDGDRTWPLPEQLAEGR
jgi:hypothetical protein